MVHGPASGLAWGEPGEVSTLSVPSSRNENRRGAGPPRQRLPLQPEVWEQPADLLLWTGR